MRIPVLVMPDLVAAAVLQGTCRLVNSTSPLPHVAAGQQVFIAASHLAMAYHEVELLLDLINFARAAGSWTPRLSLVQASQSRGRVLGTAVLGADTVEKDLRGKTSEAWFLGPHAWPLSMVTPFLEPGRRIGNLRPGLHWVESERLYARDSDN